MKMDEVSSEVLKQIIINSSLLQRHWVVVVQGSIGTSNTLQKAAAHPGPKAINI